VAIQDTFTELKETKEKLSRAVHQNTAVSKSGILERLFTMAFSGLVYPQIWEDPQVDMAALDIKPGDNIITIASGGCNVMSYLTAEPGEIIAVDLNPAHIALNELKIVAAQRLPSWYDFHRFFADASSKLNLEAYDLFIEPHLSDKSRKYWNAKRFNGKHRIEMFANGFYYYGLLGRFIGLAHFVSRRLGADPREMMVAKNLQEQRAIFNTRISPLFDKKSIRWLASLEVSLYGLGIPPAQYHALAGGKHMADVLRERTRKLACDFPLSENYFARQAFNRSYGGMPDAALPGYLEKKNFQTVRDMSERVTLTHDSITHTLAAKPSASIDAVVLLDAQDWMSREQLNDLWREITRTARPGARVIFRTAAQPDLLPGQVSPEILNRWSYDEAASKEFNLKDRSAIYGGCHLYKFIGESLS